MGLMGLILAMVGLYGLVAYSVSRRTREIGIRMAIGADRRTVVWMVLRQGLQLGVAGVAVGLVVALLRLPRGHFRALGLHVRTRQSPDLIAIALPLLVDHGAGGVGAGAAGVADRSAARAAGRVSASARKVIMRYKRAGHGQQLHPGGLRQLPLRFVHARAAEGHAQAGQVEKRWSYASWTSPSHYNLLMGLMPHASPRHVFASEYYKQDFLKFNERLGAQRLEFKSLVPRLYLPPFLQRRWATARTPWCRCRC